MIIRADQITALEESGKERYKEQLRALFRQQFPQLVSRLDDRTLLACIEEAYGRAKRLGVATDRGFVGYIGLALASGPAFHTNPKISGYLEMPGGDPDAKVEWLFKRVVEKLRDLSAAGGAA